jgi:hypothetical protein
MSNNTTNIDGDLNITNIPFEDDMIQENEILKYLDTNPEYIDKFEFHQFNNESILVNGKRFYPFNLDWTREYYSRLIENEDEVNKLFLEYKNKNKETSDEYTLKENFKKLFNYLNFGTEVMTKTNFPLVDEIHPLKLFYLNGYKNNYPELEYLGYLSSGINLENKTDLKIIFTGKYYNYNSEDQKIVETKIKNNLYVSSIGLNEEQLAINYFISHRNEIGTFQNTKNGRVVEINITNDNADTFTSIQEKINREKQIVGTSTKPAIRRGGNTKKNKKRKSKSKRRVKFI